MLVFARLVFISLVSISMTNIYAQSGAPTEPKQVFDRWEKHVTASEAMFKNMTWKMTSDNEPLLKSGVHNLFREDDKISWFTGDSPISAKHVIANNDAYSFVLAANAESDELVMVDLRNYNEGGQRRKLKSFLIPTGGGLYGFMYLPSMQCKLHEFSAVADYLEFSEPVKTKSGTYEMSFVVNKSQLEKQGRKVVAQGPVNAKESLLVDISRKGLKQGLIEIDPDSWLPVRFQIELEFFRMPMTLQVIRAANSAGQRQPDGSKFPDSMAEPEGDPILEKQGMECRWKYQKQDGVWLVSEFDCKKLREDLNKATPAEYTARAISYDAKLIPDVFQLKAFGMPEPSGSGSGSGEDGSTLKSPQNKTSNDTSDYLIWPWVLGAGFSIVLVAALSSRFIRKASTS